MTKLGPEDSSEPSAHPAVKDIGAAAAYCAFGYAAELQDRGFSRDAAAWQTFGEAIWSLLARPPAAGPVEYALPVAPMSREPRAAAPLLATVKAIAAEMRESAERIERELNVLVEAGAKGGAVSAATVKWFAGTLSTEFERLHAEIDRLCDLVLADAWNSRPPEPGAIQKVRGL